MAQVFGRPFIKRFALSHQTAVCLSVLSVTFMYCGPTVGWIKMKFGTEVGIDPGDTVLDGDQASPTETGTAAPPHFLVQMSIVAKRSPISVTAELLFRGQMPFRSLDQCC